MIMGIKRIELRNPDIRAYELKQQVGPYSRIAYDLPLTFFAVTSDEWKELGHTGQNILKELNRVDGLIQAGVSGSHIAVRKSIDFTWDEVEKDLLHAIELVLVPLR